MLWPAKTQKIYILHHKGLVFHEEPHVCFKKKVYFWVIARQNSLAISFHREGQVFEEELHGFSGEMSSYTGGGPLGYCSMGSRLRAKLLDMRHEYSSSAVGSSEATPSSKSMKA